MAEKTSQPWTVLNLLNWAKDYLARAGVESSRLSAEVLLAHVLRCERIQLYTRYDYQPAPAELAAFRGKLQQAARHEPIAYLIGRKEFYSLGFRVTRDVLVPRVETEILVAEAISHLGRLGRAGFMWDCCTGCGCVAIAVAVHFKDASVLATDVSAEAVAVARENAERHKVTGRVTCGIADLLTLPADWQGPHAFDVITANPPYVADGDEVAKCVTREPAAALRAGADGLDFIRRIVAGAPAFLKAGGTLIMEFGYDQADAVRDLVAATGQFAE
ncbi:MAG: peptide chain release factor N(5)-glutamine methyltransferase, partial [Phycisphaerae bacterium]|nr:peptide chain release factor N(5)-glutamine methyltransferase [Phycisphaerae bacterium]